MDKLNVSAIGDIRKSEGWDGLMAELSLYRRRVVDGMLYDREATRGEIQKVNDTLVEVIAMLQACRDE